MVGLDLPDRRLRSDQRRYRLGLAITYGAGALILVFHGVFLAIGTATELQQTTGWIAPGLLLAALLYLWVWLGQTGPDGGHVLRLTTWYLAGIIVMAGAFLGTLVAAARSGAVIPNPWFHTLTWLTGGGVIGLLVGIYDVDRHLEAARARRAQQRQERLTEQVLVLVRLLRHNVRNQINLVMGAVDDADDESMEWAQKGLDRIMEISEKAGRLQTLLEEPDKRKQADVTDICRQELERLQNDRTVSVSTEFGTVPDVSVHPLFSEAVRETLQNAVEHNDRPEPSVAVTVEQRMADGTEYVSIAVADDGPGLPESERQAFEQRFEDPLDHSSSIGLWFIAWIVRASDGQIQVHENDPRGTVVSLLCRPVPENERA